MSIGNNRARARKLAAAAREVKNNVELPQAVSTGRGRLLSKAETLERSGGKTYPTIWAWMRAGKFPRGVYVGAEVCWFEDEVEAWRASLKRQRLKGDEPDAGSECVSATP
jgi:predicted DNA-binding transcriptional regulator AlpA